MTTTTPPFDMHQLTNYKAVVQIWEKLEGSPHTLVKEFRIDGPVYLTKSCYVVVKEVT